MQEKQEKLVKFPITLGYEEVNFFLTPEFIKELEEVAKRKGITARLAMEYVFNKEIGAIQ